LEEPDVEGIDEVSRKGGSYDNHLDGRLLLLLSVLLKELRKSMKSWSYRFIGGLEILVRRTLLLVLKVVVPVDPKRVESPA